MNTHTEDVMTRIAARIGRIKKTALIALGALGLAACEAPVSPTRSPDVPDVNLAVGPAARIDVTPASPTVSLNGTVQLTATVYDAAGTPLPGTYVFWHSSNWSVARVSGTGLVTGTAAGTSVITASMLNGIKGSTPVTVGNPSPPPVTNGTTIAPGEDIQTKVNASPNGTAFLIKSGVHRMQRITPKNGNTFNGEPGAVLSGARLLTSFVREGSNWVATGQTQDGAGAFTSSECQAGYPRCGRPEDLFINDQPLRHVGTLGEVGPGKWYFDYGADKIYFADDPTGRKVETSVTSFAFQGSATNVTIRGLVVEKYATPQAGAAINALGSGWVAENNEVRWNHAVGINIYSNARATGNNVHHNGQLGIGGFGSSMLAENNELAYNNWAGFRSGYAAGGLKLHGTTAQLSSGIIIRGNRARDNNGYGLWTDWNTINVTYENNTVERNTEWGILHEVGYAAVIRNNTLRANGGGIFISTSSDTEVYGNIVTGAAGIFALDQNRGTGYYGPFQLANLNVHDNTVTLTAGTVGVIQTSGTNAAFTSRNIRFTHNTYYLTSPTMRGFSWAGGTLTQTEWRAYGLDVTGSYY